MANTEGVNIPIKTTVDASQLVALEGSINALKSQLKQAKTDFNAAAPGSAAWKDAAQRVADLNVRVKEGLKPLRDAVEANVRADTVQRQLNTSIAAGVNPWTTASAKYREAQAALAAEARAAREAEAATKAANAAAAAAKNPWTTAASAWSEADANLLRLGLRNREAAAALEAQSSSTDKAAKKAANFGQAMLQGSRGIQDFSVAGIPGVVNNLEGLASALGATAGAAGGVTLVAVAIDLLMRNWGTLTAAFGSADEVKALWTALTPEEETVEKLRQFTDAQTKLAEAIERVSAARQADIAAQQAEAELLEKKAKLWKGIAPTAEQRGELPPLPGTEAETPEMKKAKLDRDSKAETFAQKAAQAIAADNAFKAKDKVIKDAENSVKSLEADRIDQKRLNELNMGGGEGSDLSKESVAEQQKLEARMKARAEQRKTLGLDLTKPLTGNLTEDESTLHESLKNAREQRQALDEDRRQKANAAVEARVPFAAADQAVQGQAQVENEARAAGAFADSGLPPAPGMFPGADQQAGIPQAIEQQRNQIQQGQQQVEQALKSQGDAVVQSLGQLQTGLTGTLGAMVQTIASLNSRLGGVEGEVKGLAENTRR